MTCTATEGPAAECPYRGGRRVKALEWHDFDGRGAKASAFLLVSYLIVQWSDGQFELSVSVPGHSSSFDGARFHPTLEAAKAAAQANYEARILACVEPPTVAEAARVLLDPVRALLEWDAARKYPIPYRVRDPLIRALAEADRR